MDKYVVKFKDPLNRLCFSKFNDLDSAKSFIDDKDGIIMFEGKIIFKNRKGI